MNEDTISFILKKLGYNKYHEGNKVYFLPVKANLKFNTKLTLEQAKELFELSESKINKETIPTLIKRTRGWNFRKNK